MRNKLLKIFLIQNKWNYVGLLSMIVICSCIQIMIAMGYQYLASRASLEILVPIALLFGVLWSVKFLLNYWIQIVGIKVDMKSKSFFTRGMIDRLFDENYSDVEKNRQEYYSTIYLRDVETVSQYTSRVFIPSCLGAFSFLFAICVGLYLSPLLTLLILCVSSCSVFIIEMYKKSLMSTEQEKMSQLEKFNQLTMSLKYNQISIRMMKAQSYMEKLIMKLWEQLKKDEKQYIGIQAKLRAMNFGIGLIMNTVWMVVALYMVYRNYLSFGSFLVFMTLSSTYNWPFFELPFIKSEQYSVENSYQKLVEYQANREKGKVVERKEAFQSLELQNLEYQYPDTEKRIQYPDIQLISGEWIAITGGSGVGKTTLSKILLGLYKPSKGKIKINGKEEKTIVECLRFGYMPQNVNLFLDESLSYNITLKDEELDFDHKKWVEQEELFKELLSKDRIREYADKLSGGELKYLGVLRTIAQKADIFVFDEFSAGLDSNKMERIFKMLREIGGTMIFITHDRKVMEQCDRCVVLNGEHYGR